MSDRIENTYYADPRINGVMVECGEEPTLIICGRVVVPLDIAFVAHRYGWRIVAGNADGRVIIERPYGYH